MVPDSGNRPGPAGSNAAIWAPLRRYIAAERRLGRRMAARPVTAALYEFLRFGIKQGWACLFGGIMTALLLATHFLYPQGTPLARYDFLFLAALGVQVTLLRLRMETLEEALVIALYHVIGTAMELFKTGIGAWTYPEPSFFHIAGVPLFSGFMYASIGSYIARAWRLFDFRFTHHPPVWALLLASTAIYANFFTHRYWPDLRLALFAMVGLLLFRTRVHFRNWRSRRSMPLLLGLLLVALFIWFAENIGTFSAVWLYPHQHAGWSMVALPKLGSWFLLVVVSYALVAMVNRPADLRVSRVTSGLPEGIARLPEPADRTR